MRGGQISSSEFRVQPLKPRDRVTLTTQRTYQDKINVILIWQSGVLCDQYLLVWEVSKDYLV
jgi:hypothetical protein